MNTLEIATFIRVERARRNISLRALSDLCRVRFTTIYDIEKGKTSGQLHTIIAILKGLGYDLLIKQKV